MTADGIFSIANVVALCTWVLLAALPLVRWIASALVPGVVAAALAALYVAILAANWADTEGGFSSLADVALLFDNRWALLAGWIHYLAFDLLVGTWEARDARARGVPHLALVPCLALTFLFGPAGWLLYLVVRAVFARRHEMSA
jgi:hypothetical protein